MNLTILGSGGSTTIPRPGCECRICSEARSKDIPYSRTGSSMFIKELNLLFDTPEEIALQLNREGIHDINYIFYTHWHPDHTFGMRIVERMYKFWLDMFVNKKSPRKKVKICALDRVMQDLKSMGYQGGNFLEYYEKSGLIETIELPNETPFHIGNFTITPFEIKTTYNYSTTFLIQAKGKRVVYAPCDVKPFPKSLELRNLDLLILGSFHLEGPLKEGITIPLNNPLRSELFSPEEVKELAEKLNARRTLLTHIEEEWGKSFDDYKQIASEYGFEVAYDGMQIAI
jgi:phosphoribosyl 1,2-cyclic phosphate phosphodiesterase